MPYIQFDGPVLSKEKKAELVEKFTKVSQEVLNMPEQAFTVIIRENDSDNVGVGGKLLSEHQK
ncbi:4-oxalocrotonate tautomerase DmpI [Peribacillus kribbensis]|uniref:4-oxalocrotonate tautomerase DmpI n=1 Tax=Peribacillus kribbensis TaxID=356658 RepID=UPI000420AA69|nr:4-oxalocrotonate tautomerase DmpI [Peribacillus kribbensis]